MNRTNDELGELKEVVSFLTRFNKTYEGIVLDDQDVLTRGRVRLSIPELGWFTANESPWVESEYPGMGALTPIIGDTVAVYFMAGNISRPFYRGKLGEIKDSTPSQYTEPAKRVIFQDKDVSIVYDGSLLMVNAGSKKVKVINSADSLFKLIDDLITEIKNLKTFGSAPAHTVDPSSITALAAIATRAKTLGEI